MGSDNHTAEAPKVAYRCIGRDRSSSESMVNVAGPVHLCLKNQNSYSSLYVVERLFVPLLLFNDPLGRLVRRLRVGGFGLL